MTGTENRDLPKKGYCRFCDEEQPLIWNQYLDSPVPVCLECDNKLVTDEVLSEGNNAN
ncbi:hypothetical protein [Salinibaculum rarum]|uniref:hypothetical protein n=1 Tax=Salinibaculum rarum TaxID=3058903 RepID=UPI00265DB783|nr:hypothetical protein [Salinibaculum sp. KK48]